MLEKGNTIEATHFFEQVLLISPMDTSAIEGLLLIK